MDGDTINVLETGKQGNCIQQLLANPDLLHAGIAASHLRNLLRNNLVLLADG